MKITVNRPDLKHEDPSMIYLPYRVCEDCYLLFETMNEIKFYQIEIARFFRNPVDSVNFGVGYFKSSYEPEPVSNNVLTTETVDLDQERKKINDSELYRIMFIFTDLFWADDIELPSSELFLVFDFLGKKYKVKLEKHFPQLDYFLINFYKIFTILYDCDTFNQYIDKNRVLS